jgi:hypothetical protein
MSREADDVCVDVEFGRDRTRKEIRTALDAVQSFELLKSLAHGQPRVAHVVKTCNACETHVIIRVSAVKTRKFSRVSRVEHGHRTGVTRWYQGKWRMFCGSSLTSEFSRVHSTT